MTEGSARVYRVKSSEGHVFVVYEAVALQSGYLSYCTAAAVVEIPWFIAESKTLEKVLEWCEKHTPAHKAAVPPDVLQKWEDEYVTDGVLKSLLSAAWYLKIPELEYRLCDRQAQLQIALRKWEEDMRRKREEDRGNGASSRHMKTQQAAPQMKTQQAASGLGLI